MSSSSGVGGLSGASSNSLWSDPTLLGQLLGGVNVSGLQGVLEAEEEQAAAPLSQLSTQQSTLSSQGQAYSAIQGALQTVLGDAQGLSTDADINQTGAPTSSAPTVATGSGTGGPYGDYALAISSLATPGSVNSAFQSGSAASSLGWNGTIQITVYVGIPPQQTAVTVNVPVAAGDSLNTIAQNIQSDAANTLPSGTELSAVVLPTTQDGEAGNVLSLSVNGGLTASGVTTTGTVPGLGFTDGTTYSPASYSINGVGNQSSTNTVQNAISGVTLNLLSTGSTSLTIGTNPSATAQQASGLVSDIQTAIQTIQQYTGQGGALAGNASLNNLVSQLQSALTAQNTSLASGYQSLADMGLNVSYSQTSGASMSFNQAAFQSALSQNPEAVTNLFAGSGGIASQITNLVQPFVQTGTGVIASYQSGIQSQESLLAGEDSALEQTVDQEQTQLQTQFMDYLQQIANNYSQQSFISDYVNLQNAQSGSSGSGSGSSSSSG